MTLYDNLNHYDIGDLVNADTAFRDQNTGLPFDPSALTFTYKNPTGISTTLTFGMDAAFVKLSIGNYRVAINANATGIWSWRCASTGNGQSAVERQFYVKPSLVA